MNRKWILVLVSVLFLVSSVFVFAGGKGEAAGKGYTIGFSNSYGGNTYRQTMEMLFKKLADQMVADGTLKSYKMLQSNNNVATQVSQIESLILEGVNAIIIDPGSASGLNGAIEKAVKAKIPVVIVNDGPITSEVSVNAQGAGPGFGAHICDVEVDKETGHVTIVRYTAVQDVGRAIHPSYVEGQIQGGAAQEVGGAGIDQEAHPLLV